MDFDLEKYFQRIRQVIGTEPANEREKNILDVLNSIPPGKQILPGGSEVGDLLPLIGLDTQRPFYSDKAVAVTPITTAKIEGIKKIIDPVIIDKIDNPGAVILADASHRFAAVSAGDDGLNKTLLVRGRGAFDKFSRTSQKGNIYGYPFWRFGVALDWTTGAPLIDLDDDIPDALFCTYNYCTIYGIYLTSSNGASQIVWLDDGLGNRVIPPTILPGNGNLIYELSNMPLVTLEKTSNPQLIFNSDSPQPDNYIMLWGKFQND